MGISEKFNSEAYDSIYKVSRKYAKHYSALRFYPVWNYIAEHLDKSQPVIELGCGPGHLAHLLYDRGFRKYVGYDFSPVAIKQAKTRVPGMRFILHDLRKLKMGPGVYVSVEVFEHIKCDTCIISKIPSGTKLMFSVPNYTVPNHYRGYSSEEFIREYYKDFLDISEVIPFQQHGSNIIYMVNSTTK